MTITLDETTARWARVEAARHDTSMSRFVGDLLHRHMTEAARYDTAMADYLARPPRRLRSAAQPYPARDDLHDRADLR